MKKYTALESAGPLLLGVLLAQALSGCGGNGGPPSMTPEPVPTSSSPPPRYVSPEDQGRFIGTVTIAGVSYFGDAIVTLDRQIRLYIGDPYVPGGALQVTRPSSSAQFVGLLDAAGKVATGSGVLVGDRCATAGAGRVCGKAATAELSVSLASKKLSGEMRVAANGDTEVWRLDLDQWPNTYEFPASMTTVAGLYFEHLAEFAGNDEMVISVDSAGRMFFQSAHSGCVGNGSLAPHLDGKFAVYDVTLRIDSCDAEHASLNGDFVGLASDSASSVWNYDYVLRIWLSTRDSPRAGVTLLAAP